MRRKRAAILLTVLMLVMILPGCGRKNVEKPYNIMWDDQFDAVFLDTSIEDFIASGFHFGDSCNVAFSNGLILEDIPFFNGFYVRPGSPLIVGYPGYEYITVTRNIQGLWTEAGLTESDTAVVTLNEAGKYLREQEMLNQTYSNNRDDYRDDVQFSNFRALRGGRLKGNFLFRGASPVDNAKNRAAFADSLQEQHGVRFILDLADSEEEFLDFRSRSGFSSSYAAGLYDTGNMALLDMSSNYRSDEYRQKLARGLRKMTGAEGPFYIHCLEGKDRTGFVCFLLEALAGAGYEEMAEDYMKTYENYYGITKEGSPEKYDAVLSLYFDGFASYLHGTEDREALYSADYTRDAVKYLTEAGMTTDEIEALRSVITKASGSN